MSDNAQGGNGRDQSLNLINSTVGVSIDQQMTQHQIDQQQSRQSGIEPELTAEEKNKIKENAVKKMKQINAVIKDFYANIDGIKLKMKDFCIEVQKVEHGCVESFATKKNA